MIICRLAVALVAGSATILLAGCGSSDAVTGVRPNAAPAAPGAPDGVTTTSGEHVAAERARLAAAHYASTPAAAPTGALPPVPPAAVEGCNPNYRQCVPNAVDVDCADVPGQDGPRFVRGPIRVTGVDVYHLDGTDQDGVACERSSR